MKYPNRTNYNEDLGEGAACLFDPDYNICVTVQWNGKKYVITHAWREPSPNKIHKMMDYPFIHSSGDSKKVFGIVQTNCEHKWDYYPKHAYCLLCGLYKEGNFEAETAEKEKTDFARIEQARIKKAVKEGAISIGRVDKIPKTGIIEDMSINELSITSAPKVKTCAYRIRTFKLDDNQNTIITSNWMCLLENGEFFRQRCKNLRKKKCQHSN